MVYRFALDQDKSASLQEDTDDQTVFVVFIEWEIKPVPVPRIADVVALASWT
jgi:hypothetical protein